MTSGTAPIEGSLERPVDHRAAVAKLPLVTVVVISYNHGDYLEVCLNSVFDQTYPHIQCIVVDNASTDGSQEIIERRAARTAAGRAFEPILSPVNLHLTKGIIAGFGKAAGAYVIFLDGDDYLMPTCIEAHICAHLVSRRPVGVTAVDMFQSRDADLVVGTGADFSNYVMSGVGQKAPFCRMKTLDAFRRSGLSETNVIEERDLHFVERRMTRRWPWSPTSGLCFRQEAVALMFNYHPNILGGTDNYLLRGISSLTGSITIDRPLAVYRLHGNNMFTRHPTLTNFMSHSREQLAASNFEVSHEIVECFKLIAPQLAARLDNVDAYIEAIDMISRIGPRLKRTGLFSSYILEFITDNYDMLVAAFGEKTTRRWKRRYTLFHEDLPRFTSEAVAKGLKRLRGASQTNDRTPGAT